MSDRLFKYVKFIFQTRSCFIIFMLQLVSLDGLHSGVPTRTTPTLTPTTLRSIEQTFLELTSETASHSREAGFVPPLVEPSQPTPAQTQNTAVHHPPPTTITLVENQQTQQPQQPARRNMGGRRPTRTIGMTPEEEERRQIRRERNKMAAARCRKRRMDHTNALLEVSVGLQTFVLDCGLLDYMVGHYYILKKT